MPTRSIRTGASACSSLVGTGGELCMHYASTIDWTMAMGTAYLLAERYATIMVHQDPALYELGAAPRELQ